MNTLEDDQIATDKYAASIVHDRKYEAPELHNAHTALAIRLVCLKDKVAELASQLKADQIHKGIDPVFEHMRRAVLALESEVKELKDAQTPRPMSEAPNTGTVRVVRDVDAQYIVAMSPRPDGWLPLPVDQGDG